MHRFDIGSVDGTPIAIWTDGDGPAIVLVHGSVSDHSTLLPLIDELAHDMTVFAMDRRGFGASGDASGSYSIERDFEDVAAVVDAVQARTGEPVALFGHSYGANCAMGGAALTANVHHLVLYEPSLGLKYAPGSIEAVDRAVAEGDRDAAIVAIFVGVLEMSEAQIEDMRASTTPTWATRVASAHTLPRECRTEQSWVYRPGQFAAVTAPALFLTGSETPADLASATATAAAAIRDSRIYTLEGHGHVAHKADPSLVAGLIRQFVSS